MQAYKIISVVSIVLAIVTVGLFAAKPIWGMGSFFLTVLLGLIAGFLWEKSDDYVARQYFH